MMHTDPLDLPVTSGRLRALARQGRLDADALERALAIAGYTPAAADWRRFVDAALLLLGAALSIAGVFFFFAYNWADMPRLAKFGVIEAAMLLVVGLAAYKGLASLVGRVALLAAAMLAGVLQAVVGQVYQTGADSYLLFGIWALLILGWVAIGAFAPLWLLLLALLNLSLFFYWTQVLGAESVALLLALAGLNAVWLCAWELARGLGVGWMAGRWMPRVVALAAGGPLALATIQAIFAPSHEWVHDRALVFAPILYIGYTLFVLLLYSRYIHDLFMLAAAALGIIVVVTALGLKITDFEEGNLIILSVMVIAQTALMVHALRRIARSWEAIV